MCAVVGVYKLKLKENKQSNIFLWTALITFVLTIVGDVWFLEAHRLALYFKMITLIYLCNILGGVLRKTEVVNILVIVGFTIVQCVNLLQGAYGFLPFNLII